MNYLSTRTTSVKLKSAEAIVSGLSSDGGLFIPEVFPQVTPEQISDMSNQTYSERAAFIMSLYLCDYTKDEIEKFTKATYNSKKENGFDAPEIAPLHQQNDTTYFLELWHGPTGAFKDMALQVMPHLLTTALKKTGEKRTACILVATSGDTGKAALDGFCDIDGLKIMVFYPQNGVSPAQKLQMTSQEGNNVNVVAVEGNFDDSQTGVKEIFKDSNFSNQLNKIGYFLSSANSINWGRLVPQIAYYFSAYADLLKNGKIKTGEKVNFCVPTGNFGNILAAYYAEKMGLPVNKLICASNRNDVLTQFINTGIYNKNRPFYTTVSPSMDILVSSNLERLLFELSGKDGSVVTSYMKSLSETGTYSIGDNVKKELERVFASGFCTEEETFNTINNVYKNSGYLIDTHTAVAYKVLSDYRKSSNDKTVSVIVSTASPFKFSHAVLKALEVPAGDKKAEAEFDNNNKDDVHLIEKLSQKTGVDIPKSLKGLDKKTSRFNETATVDKMKDSVLRFIKEG